jgi:hypothetical protein
MRRAALGALLLAAWPATAWAGRGPLVEQLIVGRTKVLDGPHRLRASAATVSVGRKRCAVAAGTPFAALLAARRAGGPAFAVRDYGSCSRRASDSGQLFVYRIGPDPNGGRSGWVFKVGNRVGSTGAADVSGPFGNGRLRSGQRVLWFWCAMSARGCQRTLGVLPARRRVAPGGALRVRVVGYDDAGRAVAVAGATVRVAHSYGVTGRDGSVVLRAPTRPGIVRVIAVHRGLVPAFPEEVRVG